MMAESALPSSQSDCRPSSPSETLSEPTSDPFSISSTSTSPPPTPHDIDHWNRHISLQEFGEGLQGAAKALFPSERKSRYTNVTVLILSWQDEDPNLPVSVEISRLVHVFKNIYHFDVEEWQIPTQNSHWAVNRKIMDFVQPTPGDKEQLKIVYYAGHGRLTKTRLLEWTSWRDNPRSKSQSGVQPVQWSGIQVLLEQADSDVLILLDCCSAGTANSGGGRGVTELIAACPYNATANGVGQYSFTNSLVIELTELSQKPSFSMGELYSNIFIRAQCRLTEHGRERHPAPIHLVLTQQSNFPRSIQLSVRNELKITTQVGHQTTPNSTPSLASPLSGSLDPGPDLGAASGPEKCAVQSPTSKNKLVPRLLFAIRLNESFQPNELSAELLSEWFRMIPLIGVEEVKVEAGFNCFSSVVMVSVPMALYAYIPTDPAVICLGPITSANLILQKNQSALGQIETSRKATSSVSGSHAGSRDGRGIVSANMRKKRVRAFSSPWAKLRTGRSPSRPIKTSSGTPPFSGTRAKIMTPKPAAESNVAGDTAARLPSNSLPCPEKTSLKSILNKPPLLPSSVFHSEKTSLGSIFSTTPGISVPSQPTTVFRQRSDSSQEAVYQEILGPGSGELTVVGDSSLSTKQGHDQQESRSNRKVNGSNHNGGATREQYIQSPPNGESIGTHDLNSRCRLPSRVRVLGGHDEMTDTQSSISTPLYAGILLSRAISHWLLPFKARSQDQLAPSPSSPISPAQKSFMFAVMGEMPGSDTLETAWTWYINFLEGRIREAWVPLLRHILRDINESSYTPLESDFAAVMHILTETVAILQGPNLTISDIVDELYNQSTLKETIHDRSHVDQLVFAVVGWICLLYTPKIHAGSRYFELATPGTIIDDTPYDIGFVRHRPSHNAIIRTHQASLDYDDRPLHSLLRAFGKIIPERDADRTNGFETVGASYDEPWTEVPLVCYHTLHTIAGIRIEWVDCLCLHLEFDPLLRRLRMFRFPSFCFIMASNQNPGPLSQLFRDSCASEWPPADVDDARDFFKEVLLSYRVIFGKDRRSAKHFRQLAEKGPQVYPDPLLEILCSKGSDSSQVLQILDAIRISDSRQQFSPSDDFPFLSQRLLKLQKHVQSQQPNGLHALWHDRRDAFRWWTFWAVVILGGLAILLGFLQFIFRIWHIYN